ncbi:hypothetical protein HRG_010957 [Hirsutella rhossiliensis]|uniref:Uncharacterized protein n=1 Tax=Hirsutella rhossiliensis TaxID=111463 RepID=A0A9P8MMR1_9HYPO|nr:uncharacterized protein HRG_10957 [Hirsutella rhossiliensis]KAH0957864.1 hypothetical protein HRG_10957 [Hirsutella rhossiliensis]
MTAGSDGPAAATSIPVSGSPSPGSEFNNTKLHLLLPATRSNVNLCKTLLTLTILGYPTPHIIGWEAQDGDEALRGGGSHLAKITAGLEYVNDAERRKQPGFDDELIFMIDSYDIWFQLPVEVLIARYRAIVAQEDARVARRMGRAFDREGIRSQVIFGAGKRCAPNQLHTVACYPVPESPLPMDLRRGNADTLLGRNIFSNFRTRYLNSGYIIGPVGAVRPMLEKAKERLDQCAQRTAAWFDNGSGRSDECYHGSDQSIFADMYGEQEIHREVMRRRHRTLLDDWLDVVVPNRPGARPAPSHVLNLPVQDYLKPAFTHQAYRASHAPGGKPFEFGIGLDYWSLLGHQTANAEFDSRYIRHDKALEPQVGQQGIFDCAAKAPMPTDVPQEAAVLRLLDDGPDRWETMPLYTEICVGSVPVMIHHNSVDKSWREKQWNQTWWHGWSRRLLEERQKAGTPQLMEGVPTDKGTRLRWEKLCPHEVEGELFRDADQVS